MAGAEIVGGNFAGQVGAVTGGLNGGAVIVAHENVLNRMSAPAPAGQTARLQAPTGSQDTFFGNQKNLFFNGEAIEVIHIPAASTDGDVMAFFRRSDVIAAGDIFTPDQISVGRSCAAAATFGASSMDRTAGSAISDSYR